MLSLDVNWIRSQFPGLSQELNGQPIAFFDGPGGTQVPQSVMDSIVEYMTYSNANAHGAFVTSARTDELVMAARSATSDFLGCDWDEVVFGANMTTLTFALSRAIGRELHPSDEIVVTLLDHEANVTPWRILEEQGITIRVVDIHPEDCTLDLADLERQITPKTKLVAIGYASNAVGTINDLSRVVKLAHAVGAWVFVDAVHYAPHGALDVRVLDCDFLVCSDYKFFGPHVGILYGKRAHLERLHPYKVRPAPEENPSRWESGTQNYEGLAGLVATLDYLTSLGRLISPSILSRRAAIVAAMQVVQEHERELFKQLVIPLIQIAGLRLYGITDPAHFEQRTPTAAIRLAGYSPKTLATALGKRGIFTWHGNFYAQQLTERLGIESNGGFVRIGLAHYNTLDEIHRLLQALDEVACSKAL